jgi:hypothetical protein
MGWQLGVWSNPMSNKVSGWDRRDFFRTAAAAGFVAAASRRAAAAPRCETEADIVPPSPSPDADMNTADILVETLIGWGASSLQDQSRSWRPS